MNINLEHVDGHLNREADICIIGAGVAGQTLASEFQKTNLKVILVESGQQDFRRDTQDMARGENVGHPYYNLEDSRLRLFGGTAAIWGGRCAELDEIDFEIRPYVPHSGWPISKADLDPYYDKSFNLLGLVRPAKSNLWAQYGNVSRDLDSNKFDSGLWAFDEQGERFTNLKRHGLEQCDTVLNATLTDLEKDESGKIVSATCHSLKNTSLNVKAKVFVLAAGAIETARILLAKGQGLGAEHDQLGRYFMEHPHARGGEITPVNAAQTFRVLPRAIRHQGARYAAFMRPSEVLQREQQILNSALSITLRRHAGENMDNVGRTIHTLKQSLPSKKIWRSLYHKGKAGAVRWREFSDPWRSVAKMKRSKGKSGVYVVIRAEQSPNPQSRITLSKETDSLGMPRVALDWQFQDIDRETIRVMMETLNSEYQRLGWGSLEPSKWLYDKNIPWHTDPLISTHPIGGYHHMGGVRMSHTPRTGVVDSNCKLHDSPNLYVAGSGVFPTGGWANPTITIIALALRLGDHLKRKLV